MNRTQRTMQVQPNIQPSWRDIAFGIPKVSSAQWRELGLFKRWLIATRASVLPLTLFAVTFAAAIAPPQTAAAWGMLAVVTLALLLAHATNNLLNDYVDYHAGLDQDNYVRSRYGVHVLDSGLMSASTLRRYILGTGTASLLLAVVVCALSPFEASLYAGAGGFLVLFYTWPLKRIALGELAVFAAWGPLMVGGTAVVVTGSADASVVAAGAVYGLGPSLVICAKHRDKLADDRARGVLTLPSLIGERATAWLLIALSLLQALGLVWLAWANGLYGLLAALLVTPQLLRLIRLYNAPPPAARPENFPATAWPLWYTSHSFLYARNTGLLLTAGVFGQQLLTGS